MADTNDDDDYIESDDLLYSYTYGVRLLHTGSKKDEIIIGIMLEETDDSFLLGMAASISRKEDLITIEQVAQGIAYLRFIKTSFRAVSFPPPDFEEAYLHFLKSESADIFPELLEIIGESEESGWEPPFVKEVEDIPEQQQQPTKSSEQATEQGILINGTFTSDEVKSKIESAIKAGFLLINPNVLPS
jgi:hypothetical protein